MERFFKRPKLSRTFSVDARGNLQYQTPKGGYWQLVLLQQNPRFFYKVLIAFLIIFTNIFVYYFLQQTILGVFINSSMSYWAAYQIITIMMLSISFMLFLLAIIFFNILESNFESEQVLKQIFE
jgi:hypothetical protein